MSNNTIINNSKINAPVSIGNGSRAIVYNHSADEVAAKKKDSHWANVLAGIGSFGAFLASLWMYIWGK